MTLPGWLDTAPDRLRTEAGHVLSQAKASAERALRDSQYPHPICKVLVNGRDITAAVTQRLISIQLTDNRGMEADTLDIQLSDHDGQLAIPPRNAQILLWLG